MISRRVLGSALIAGGVLLGVACGNSDVENRDYGQPPDPNLFNPGLGGSDPYGYGKGPGTLACPPELKRCNYTITYPAGTESMVELRGDFGGPSTWETGVPMTKKGNVWSADITVPFNGPIQYKFIVDGVWKIDPAQPTVTDANSNTNNTFAGKTCDPAICAEEGQLPPGVFDWRDSIIYFVFVDRFNDGDGNNGCKFSLQSPTGDIANYMGGDWQGVTAKINSGYFTDLGVNTLWITVPLDNPNVGGQGVGGDSHYYSGYHGYWPKVDSDVPTSLSHEECFGTMNDLKTLVSTAHTKGLKVLFDYAMVHVHDTSAIVTQHSDWFWPNNNNFKGGNGNCVCGDGCSWDVLPDRERCWFTNYLPHWNYTNQAARDYSVSAAVEWVKQTQDASGFGADGFRADAIKHVDISWLTSLRAKIKSDIIAKQTPPQRFYMVGETYDFGNRDVIKGYVDPATKLDGQFDFPLRKQVVENVIMRFGNMSDLAGFMNDNDYYYGASAVMSTFIGNHDLPRIIHLAANNRIFGDDQGSDGKSRAWSNQPGAVTELEAYERVANGFAVLFTNRGAPLVYYGDEIGMPGAGDPDNRRMMTWGTLNANQTFLHDRVKALGDIRSKHPALRRGTRTTISADADSWTFVRATTGDTVYVAINRGDSAKTVNGLPSGALTELVTNASATGPSISIPARQTRIFVTK